MGFLSNQGSAMAVSVTLAKYLLDHKVPYDVVKHSHTENALASAATSGLRPEQVVKAVVLKDSDGFTLALLPASRQIQFDRLRTVAGKYLDIANEEQVETLFPDCEPGSVPALGAAYGLNVIVEDSLTDQPELYLEAGDHAILLHISGTNFNKLIKGYRRGQFAARY